MYECAPVSNEYDEKAVEAMNSAHFTVTRISDKWDFGHGSISAADAEPQLLVRVDEIIRSPDILVPIDKDDEGKIIDDDGCGDGRGVMAVFTLSETYKRSLNRAKVFGGAVVMTAASIIGVGQARDKTLPGVFGAAIKTLEQKGIDFGAHIDEQAHGDNSGCGAIDRAPETLLATIRYEKPIRNVIKALGVESTELDAIYSNLRSYVVSELSEHPEYSGRQIMDQIISAGKVVKQLGGAHQERAIVLNTLRDYTVNQALVRKATDNAAQAFAVDIWRMEDIATNLYKGQPHLQQQAFLSGLVYTLAVAAVLTKGDLPVYMTQPQPTAVPVA